VIDGSCLTAHDGCAILPQYETPRTSIPEIMILYHFSTSPYARRVRLALAHKGLSAELRDARANPEHASELRRLNPVRTVPLLIDGQRVIADSSAICHYIDRKQPDPPLWPVGLQGAEAFEFVALADSAIDVLVDLGLRYSALGDHPSFPKVRAEYVGRAQGALDKLAQMVGERRSAPALCGEVWSAADIAVCTMVIWLEGIPVRAATFPPAKTLLALGWTLPPTLIEWTAERRNRPDVRALDQP
jgi:glutathione S-transferase